MNSPFFNQNKKTTEIEQLRKGLEPREFFTNLLGWLQNADDKMDEKSKLQQVTNYYKNLSFAIYKSDFDELKRYIEDEDDKKISANPDAQLQTHQANISILTSIQIAMVRDLPVSSKKSKSCIIL